MGEFTRIPADTFEQMQLGAGILLYDFDLTGNTPVKDEDIICATTGGISASCVPSYSDMGEDVDNCPANLLELKNLDGWDCKLGFTSLSTSPKAIRLALGAADIDSNDPTHIIPRGNAKRSDARNVWWAGDRADGGVVLIVLKNALSTSGFSLQTTKAGKGNTSVELTGHPTIETQHEVPMEFYSREPSLTALSVTTAEGSESGFTRVTVSPAKQSGNSYKYKLGASAESVSYGQELTTGWTAWNGIEEIDAQDSTHITVAEVSADNKAVSAGNAAVNSAT